jgi:hypothetical protein
VLRATTRTTLVHDYDARDTAPPPQLEPQCVGDQMAESDTLPDGPVQLHATQQQIRERASWVRLLGRVEPEEGISEASRGLGQHSFHDRLSNPGAEVTQYVRLEPGCAAHTLGIGPQCTQCPQEIEHLQDTYRAVCHVVGPFVRFRQQNGPTGQGMTRRRRGSQSPFRQQPMGT